MVIALLIMLPIISLMVGFFTLYGVYMGLKWNHQMKVEQKAPESPMPSNPIQPIIERNEIRRNEKEVASVLEEWLNGVPKEGDSS